MKKALIFLIALFLVVSCILGACSVPETDNASASEDYLVLYNGDYYTYQYRDQMLTHSWDTGKDILPDKKSAVAVDADDTKKELFPVLVQEFSDDPDHNFILECGSLFGDRLLYKVSYVIPDYLDENTHITRIFWTNETENEKADDKIVLIWDDPQTVDAFMQFVRRTAADSASGSSLPADKTKETLNCYLEFENVDGKLNIGFFVYAANGTPCMLFSDFPAKGNFENTYAVGPLPETLQDTCV